MSIGPATHLCQMIAVTLSSELCSSLRGDGGVHGLTQLDEYVERWCEIEGRAATALGSADAATADTDATALPGTAAAASTAQSAYAAGAAGAAAGAATGAVSAGSAVNLGDDEGVVQSERFEMLLTEVGALAGAHAAAMPTRRHAHVSATPTVPPCLR